MNPIPIPQQPPQAPIKTCACCGYYAKLEEVGDICYRCNGIRVAAEKAAALTKTIPVEHPIRYDIAIPLSEEKTQPIIRFWLRS